MDYLFASEMQIFDIIHQKGWNAYLSTSSVETGAEAAIRRGAATSLALNERYVLLPLTSNSSDPGEVMGKLEEFAVRNNRETPSILVEGERFSWTGFIPQERCVKIVTPIGHFVPYDYFLKSLETITPFLGIKS